MSHLIPQVRTDKNGRSVIRHMKPDNATSTGSSSRAIPVAQLPSQGLSNVESARSIRGLVITLAGSIPVPSESIYEGFIDDTYEEAPQLVELMLHCLSNGSEPARYAAQTHIQASVKMFRDGMGGPGAGLGLHSRLIEVWNEENVRAESGNGRDVDLASAKRAIRDEFRRDEPSDHTYWRGLAAARIVYALTDGTVSLDRSIDFILTRAGAHPDMATVIDIAVDRRTLDMDVIDQVIRESQEAVSLREGFL